MSTDLAIYQKITDPIVAIKTLGHSIAASRMMGAETPAQGEILAMQCLSEGVPPFTLQRRNHIIKGQITMKASAMLAGFNEIGGKHRIIEQTADAAEVELVWEGKTYRFRLTWDEAKQEPFPYLGKEEEVIDALENNKPLKIKPKYRTPRSRMQMLWSRCIDHAVQSVTPQVNHGIYTPEIASDLAESNGSGNGEMDSNTVDAEIVSTTTAAAPTEEPPFENGKPVDATAEPTNGAPTGTTSGACSAEQSTQIKELWGELGATVEQRDQMLAKRGVNAVRSLTAVQASDLIVKLKAEQAKRAAASPEAKMDDAALVAGIRERLKKVNQVHPGTVAKVTDKLNAAGMKTLDELSRQSAEELYAALGGPDIAAFFGAALFTPRSPKN